MLENKTNTSFTSGQVRNVSTVEQHSPGIRGLQPCNDPQQSCFA
jgi:hypothetical protein